MLLQMGIKPEKVTCVEGVKIENKMWFLTLILIVLKLTHKGILTTTPVDMQLHCTALVSLLCSYQGPRYTPLKTGQNRKTKIFIVKILIFLTEMTHSTA